MVDWKRVELDFTLETHNHIMKHGIKRFEVEEVFNHKIIPRKVRDNEET
ncbi:MAG: hypothetical protein U9N36_05520 [Euryarchaeota archaeon]|nr:hypothetical protein [Euryarchaeota archaeon]